MWLYWFRPNLSQERFIKMTYKNTYKIKHKINYRDQQLWKKEKGACVLTYTRKKSEKVCSNFTARVALNRATMGSFIYLFCFTKVCILRFLRSRREIGYSKLSMWSNFLNGFFLFAPSPSLCNFHSHLFSGSSVWLVQWNLLRTTEENLQPASLEESFLRPVLTPYHLDQNETKHLKSRKFYIQF